jgi:hypothetical protein
MKESLTASVWAVMSTHDLRYAERTPWPHWADALFWGALLITSFATLAGLDSDLPDPVRVPFSAGILAVGLAVRWIVGGMTVRVDDTGLFIHLGKVPLLHRRVSFEEIERVEVVKYRPIREFGGWGIRGWGKKKAWTTRGDQAVRLHLTSDRLLYIGSDVPYRLAERIRTIGGIETWEDAAARGEDGGTTSP